MHSTRMVIDAARLARKAFGPLMVVSEAAYSQRVLSTIDAARVLGLDRSTVSQQAFHGRISGEHRDGHWWFALSDLADYIRDGRNRGSRWNSQWTDEELRELEQTGRCSTRSAKAAQLKRIRRAKCKH